MHVLLRALLSLLEGPQPSLFAHRKPIRASYASHGYQFATGGSCQSHNQAMGGVS